MRYLLGLIWIGVVALLPGCVMPENSAFWHAEMIAQPNLNPNDQNTPTPAHVTFYQLSSPANFRSADFFALQDNPERVLGNNLLAEQSVDIKPGQHMVVDITLNAQAQFIGIIVDYHHLTNTSGQLLIPIDNTTPVLQLSGNQVSMESNS